MAIKKHFLHGCLLCWLIIVKSMPLWADNDTTWAHKLRQEQQQLRECVLRHPTQLLKTVLWFVPLLIIAGYGLKSMLTKLPRRCPAPLQWSLGDMFWVMLWYLSIMVVVAHLAPAPHNFTQELWLLILINSVVCCLALTHMYWRYGSIQTIVGFAKDEPRQWGYAIATYLCFLPFFIASAWITNVGLILLHYEPEVQRITMEIMNASRPVFCLACVVAVVVVPLTEEIFFRVLLFKALYKQLGRGVALGGSALLFAAFHQSLTAFFPILLLGILLALIYERTQNIWFAVLIHATHNALTLLYWSNLS